MRLPVTMGSPEGNK